MNYKDFCDELIDISEENTFGEEFVLHIRSMILLLKDAEEVGVFYPIGWKYLAGMED